MKNKNWFIFMIFGKSKKFTMFSLIDVQFRKNCIVNNNLWCLFYAHWSSWTDPDTWIYWGFSTKFKFESKNKSKESNDEKSFKLWLQKWQVSTQPWCDQDFASKIIETGNTEPKISQSESHASLLSIELKNSRPIVTSRDLVAFAQYWRSQDHILHSHEMFW